MKAFAIAGLVVVGLVAASYFAPAAVAPSKGGPGQIKEHHFGYIIAGTNETAHSELWTNQFKASEKINSFSFDYPKDKKRIITAFIVPSDNGIDYSSSDYKRFWDLPSVPGKNYFRISHGEHSGRLEMTPQEKGLWVFDIIMIYESKEPAAE